MTDTETCASPGHRVVRPDSLFTALAPVTRKSDNEPVPREQRGARPGDLSTERSLPTAWRPRPQAAGGRSGTRLPAMSLRLSDVTALLDGWYDPAWAEDWDAVGLVCGDPDAAGRQGAVRRRPGAGGGRRGRRRGAPTWWSATTRCCSSPVHGVAATTPKGRVVHDLVRRRRRALFTAHTNADVPADGVNESLARRRRHRRPAGRASAPDDARARQARRLRAGTTTRTRCAPPSPRPVPARSATTTRRPSPPPARDGSGRWTARDPAIGSVGEVEVVAESRIEVVLPRPLRRRGASRRCWPRTPTRSRRTTSWSSPSRGRRRARGARTDRPARRADHAARVRGPGGRGAAGDRARRAGRRRPGPARARPSWSAAGPATSCSTPCSAPTPTSTSPPTCATTGPAEFLEHGGPALVDVAHWAAEWTWLPVVERKLLDAVGRWGDTVETRVSDDRHRPVDLPGRPLTRPAARQTPIEENTLKADAFSQLKLLDVQELDSRLDQLRHRLRTCPETQGARRARRRARRASTTRRATRRSASTT